MRRAGRVVALAHQRLGQEIRPGLRTKDLDAMVLEVLERRGAIPSFKGYQGYPANICVSVNEEVVHGIPGEGAMRRRYRQRRYRGHRRRLPR